MPVVSGPSRNAVALLQKRHHFLDQEVGIFRSFELWRRRALKLRIMRIGIAQVLGSSLLARVVDAHDEHGADFELGDQMIDRFVRFPFLAAEAGGLVENILPILQVQHRVFPRSVMRREVVAGQKDSQHSRVVKNFAGKWHHIEHVGDAVLVGDGLRRIRTFGLIKLGRLLRLGRRLLRRGRCAAWEEEDGGAACVSRCCGDGCGVSWAEKETKARKDTQSGIE